MFRSFQVVNNQEIRQILTLDDVVLILSQRQLRGQIRRGLPVFTHTYVHTSIENCRINLTDVPFIYTIFSFMYSSNFMQEMQCMLQTSATSVLLGGHQENIIDYDLQQNRETQTVRILIF